MDKSFIRLIEESVKQNWDLPAFSDYKGATIHYYDLARKIEKIHIIFDVIKRRYAELRATWNFED